MTASGCGGSSQTEVEFDTNALEAERIDVQKPLNCPVMLVVYSGSNRFEEQEWLSFSLKENPDFDAGLNDDCKGDLKNIWADLMRFEEQIENHVPYIKQIYSITSSLKYFPQTRKELQSYMNKEAVDSLLYEELVQIDRLTLEGGLEFNLKVHEFIHITEESYWMKEHAPIIEKTLFKHGLKMRGFDSEKNFYCYHLFDVCKIDRPIAIETKAKELDFEYMGPAIDWFSFQKPIEEISP